METPLITDGYINNLKSNIGFVFRQVNVDSFMG
jgi:hypothetical protein